MKIFPDNSFSEKIPPSLRRLAEKCPRPLYLVGGSVRDYLAGDLSSRADWDLASPCTEEELLAAAKECGLSPRAVYANTGTVKLKGEDEYEFTRFRSDRYVRGRHTPEEIFFTEDILPDARRRDFRANAVYFEIGTERFVDPLGGIEDIRNKVLRTVAPAEKVFGEDGLRLVRLARIAAQTGFSPDEECLAGAKNNAALIRDIAPERIFAELGLLLTADKKRGDETAPYRGLCILRETGVLKEILPELALGDGMPQRADFHDHDVLEHTFRCVRYAPADVRWAALLHDVGKPSCFLKNGNFHGHDAEGARIAREILLRLKAPKSLTEEVCTLVALHMRDLDGKMKTAKVRRALLSSYPVLEKLFALKQADFSASKDDLSPAPVVVKWREIFAEMQRERCPFTLRGLAVNGNDLLSLGVPRERIGEILSALLLFCAEDGARNTPAVLLARAARLAELPAEDAENK